VPDRVLGRREKVGFEPPQARWLGSDAGRAWAGEVLLDGPDPAIDRTAVEEDLRAGAWRDPDALWRAMNVVLWRAAFS